MNQNIVKIIGIRGPLVKDEQTRKSVQPCKINYTLSSVRHWTSCILKRHCRYVHSLYRILYIKATLQIRTFPISRFIYMHSGTENYPAPTGRHPRPE
jgi:hypothetical protein